MPILTVIIWFIWVIGFYFIKRNINLKQREEQYRKMKQKQAQTLPQNNAATTKAMMDMSKQQVAATKRKRNVNQQSARLAQDAAERRQSSQDTIKRQNRRATIKDFVERVQSEQNKRNTEDLLSLEGISSEYESIESVSGKDEIDWDNFEADFLSDMEWTSYNDDEEILLEVDRSIGSDVSQASKRKIQLDTKTVNQGIVLSEILSKPKSLRE